MSQKERDENHKRSCREYFKQYDKIKKEQDDIINRSMEILRRFDSTPEQRNQAQRDFDKAMSDNRHVEINLKIMKGDCYRNKYYPKDRPKKGYD
jgi:hypothetical protein